MSHSRRTALRDPFIARVPACLGLLVVVGLTAVPAKADAQWSTVREQTQLPASHNWMFRREYVFADRLFNAFDYGHAILYETLLTRGDAPPTLLENRIHDRLTRKILLRPPHVPLEESAVMPEYAKLVPEARAMFEWAHLLHRQTYDVWADERIPPSEKDAAIAEILAYYQSRPDIAFSTRPKSMDLMDGQYYSLAFRERYPRFNGLIWAYHWLQVGLYEPLMAADDPVTRQAMAQATVARFWQMLGDTPRSSPYLMPMTAAVAPRFAERYPRIAAIFDNLHMMHDIVSDILASDLVPSDRKRAEILAALEIFRDDSTSILSDEDWRAMAVSMGIENQGGPAVGFMAALPTPTLPLGASMAGHHHGVSPTPMPAEPPADADPDLPQDPAPHVH